MVKKTVLKRSVLACCMAKSRYRRYVCVLLDAKTQFFSMKMTNLWKRRRRPFFQPSAGVLGEMSSVPSWESLQWLLQTCFSPLWDFVEAPRCVFCALWHALCLHGGCQAPQLLCRQAGEWKCAQKTNESSRMSLCLCCEEKKRRKKNHCSWVSFYRLTFLLPRWM